MDLTSHSYWSHPAESVGEREGQTLGLDNPALKGEPLGDRGVGLLLASCGPGMPLRVPDDGVGWRIGYI